MSTPASHSNTEAVARAIVGFHGVRYLPIPLTVEGMMS